MKHIITICFVLLLVVGSFFSLVALSRPSGRPALTARFVGFTNDSAGMRLAAFVLSNGSPWSVVRGSHYRVQLPTSERWTDLSEAWFPSGGSTLAAGSSEVVTLTAPTNQSEWRVAFTSRRAEGAVFTMATELLIEGQKLGLPTKYRRIGYTVSSDLIRDRP